MEKELFTVSATSDGIIIKIHLPTVSLEELDRALQIIRSLLPKG